MSLPPWPNAWIRVVLATVALPPAMATAPPLTRRVPAASRLNVIAFLALSPVAASTPVAGLKLLEIAIVVVLSKVCAGWHRRVSTPTWRSAKSLTSAWVSEEQVSGSVDMS